MSLLTNSGIAVNKEWEDCHCVVENNNKDASEESWKLKQDNY